MQNQSMSAMSRKRRRAVKMSVVEKGQLLPSTAQWAMHMNPVPKQLRPR
jgi:hypothetical protein